ncbi:MAG: cobalt transporter CbiM [Deltaproteobacteria bacterium]|nr:cobalt transporter CbiM [Deltaproteobacteria bacterium]
MHIPDGYLSPGTYVSFYAVMIPLWYKATKVLKNAFKAKHASYLALCAAFTFVVQMFNIPTPGGSSGHIVGGAIAAILLGPWAALLAISVVMIIQALLFGDGGITAIAANCFNMAVVMPFSAYYVYKIVGSGSEPSSPRRIFAAGVAGYLSLNLAAVLTAVEFGIQPLIAHSPDGTPLYAPYPLSVAVPVMAAEHLLLFGVIEAVVTGMVLAYVARKEPSLLRSSEPDSLQAEVTVASKPYRLWIGIGALVVLTPLGLIASGSAWGEWTAEELKTLIGFTPAKLKQLEGMWPGLMSNYNMTGWDSPMMSAFGYILAAAAGVSAIATVSFIVSRFISAGKRPG